jgi:hypothetical protein
VVADDYLAATRNKQRAWALAGKNAPDRTARWSRLTWIARRSMYLVMTSHNDDRASGTQPSSLGGSTRRTA